MRLADWEKNGWIRPHQTSCEEIKQLLEMVNRDIKDSGQKNLSADWQFGIAYNAALKLCTILLYSEGYRPEKVQAHYRTIRALPLILGNDKQSDADYLDICRIKRNTVEYDYIGGVTKENASELRNYVQELRKDVIHWLKMNHPEYLEYDDEQEI